MLMSETLTALSGSWADWSQDGAHVERTRPRHVWQVSKHAADTHLQVETELSLLEARAGTAEVLVVGSGYAGIELATTVAERLGSKGQVRMVTAGEPPLPQCQACSQPTERVCMRSKGSSLHCLPGGLGQVFMSVLCA